MLMDDLEEQIAESARATAEVSQAAIARSLARRDRLMEGVR